MDVIQGGQYTAGTSGVTAGRIIEDLGEVLLDQPDKAPLLVLTSKLNKKGPGNDVPSAVLKWQEDSLFPAWDTATADAATDTTEIVVTNQSYFQASDMVKFPRTGDVARVTGTTGTNKIVVVRIAGNNAIGASEPIMRFSSAFVQGGASAGSRATKVTIKTNYAQIFKKSYELTESLIAAKLHGGPELNRQRKKAAIELAEEIERSLLEGQAYADVSTSEPLYITGGLPEFITTNTVDIGGALTTTKINEMARNAYNWGNKKKTLPCGSYWLEAFSRMAEGKLQLVPKDKVYGLTIIEFMTAHGPLYPFYHPLMDGAYNAGCAWMLDLEFIEQHMFRNVKLVEDIQTAGYDKKKDEYKCEVGWKIKMEKAHAYAYGCTG